MLSFFEECPLLHTSNKHGPLEMATAGLTLHAECRTVAQQAASTAGACLIKKKILSFFEEFPLGAQQQQAWSTGDGYGRADSACRVQNGGSAGGINSGCVSN